MTGDDNCKPKSPVSLNLATIEQLHIVLKAYNLYPPENYDKEKLWELLQCSSVFRKDFAEYKREDISATCSDSCKLIQLSSSDGKVSLTVKRVDIPSPCSVCELEVCDGEGSLGQGLQCSDCESWFHNQCNSTPLNMKLFRLLANSPNYLKVYCPQCMCNNIVSNHSLYNEFQILKAEIADMKRNLSFHELSDELKRLIKDTINQVPIKEDAETNCADVTKMLSAVSETTEELQNEMSSTLETCRIDIQNTIDTIADSTSGLRNELTNTMSSVDGAVNQMITSAQKLDKFNFDDLSKVVNNSVNDLSNVFNDSLLQDETVERLSLSVASKLCGNLQTDTNTLPDSKILQQDTIESLSHSIAKHLIDSCHINHKPESVIMSHLREHNSSVAPHPSYSEITQAGIATTPIMAVPTNSSPEIHNDRIPSGMHMKHTPPSGQISKALCDENKTVAVDNITNFVKFVRNAKDTKKEFNTHFPGMKIVHAKGTRRGTLLIELATQLEAEEVVAKWKPSFFTEECGTKNHTTATLLKDKNCKGVMYHIDHDYSEDFICKEITEKANLKKNVSVKRFRKGSSTLSTVLLTFGCKEDLDTCLNNGLDIGRSPEDVHPYKRSPSVLRCWKCWRFDHTEKWCTKKSRTCQYCAQNHDSKDCISHGKDPQHDSQYKCVNCQDNRQHPSSSNECPAYLNKLAQASLFAQL